MEKKFEFKEIILERDFMCDSSLWHPDVFIQENEEFVYCIAGTYRKAVHQFIPYNEETKHLLGTTDPYEPEKEQWKPKKRENVLFVFFNASTLKFKFCTHPWCGIEQEEDMLKRGFILPDDATDEAQAFCDKLNEAIKDIR